MADGEFGILRDLQSHLRTAQVPVDKLSTLAKQGDDKLVEQFLTESISVEGAETDKNKSQLYIACFWGIKDVVSFLLASKVDPNSQNKGSLWTPLHAACFQEHGPIVMTLLEYGAQPELPDSEGRTPKDFASASDKIWPHFAALGLQRTSKSELIQKNVIKKLPSDYQVNRNIRQGSGIRIAANSRPESAYAYNSDPFIHAAVTGDVLADAEQASSADSNPNFSMWR